jgi:hypothetical protein
MSMIGLYIIAERILLGLRLTLTPLGREELRGYVLPSSLAYLDGNTTDERLSEVRWTKPHAEIMRALIEDLTECGDLELVTDEENARLVGGLTASPVLVTNPRHDSPDPSIPHPSDRLSSDPASDLSGFDAVFWFPNYQVESELETLLRKGTVDFTLASKPQDTFSCTSCGADLGYEIEAVDNHVCPRTRKG